MKKRFNLIEGIFFILLLYLFITFLFHPIKEVIREAFFSQGFFTLENFSIIKNSKFGPLAIKNTVVLGLSSVVVCGIIGIFLSFLLEYLKVFSEAVEKLLKGLLLIPFMIPGVIIVLSVLQLFGSLGVFPQLLKQLMGLKRVKYYLHGLPGILFIHGITQYIYFYVNTNIALRNLDHNRIDAARNLGANKWEVFKDIIWPHIKPAVISSALLTFFSAISSFSAPYLLEGNFKTITTEIMNAKTANKMSLASSYVIVLIIGAIIALGLYKFYDRASKDEGKDVEVRGRRVILKGANKVILKALLILIVIHIVLPIIAVIYMSFISTKSWMMDIFPHGFTLENYKNALSSERMIAPLVVSLSLSIKAVLITVPICAIGAYLTLSNNEFIKKTMGSLFLMPMILPASTLGVVLITSFDKEVALIGNKVLLGTPSLLVLAYVLLSTTVVFNTLRNEFLNFRFDTYEAAKLLGAGRVRRIFDIFIPQVMSGIFYASSLVFLRSMGEYTASAFLYTVSGRPVSIAMVSALQDYNIGVSMVYGTILILLSTIILLVINSKDIKIR